MNAIAPSLRLSATQNQKVASFFNAPSTGRRIVAGFSHIQRIGKGASTSAWYADGAGSLLNTPVEWAAVRQFEILHEADNYYIYDMNVSDINYSLYNITKMRAGGYRITIITLGHYTDAHDADDLSIFDQRIQEEITRMIHFLYLKEMSEQTSAEYARLLQNDSWRYDDVLQHVIVTMSAKRLFKPEKETLAERVFFDILGCLPSRHILHDMAAGLQLPESTKDKIWVYIAQKENQFTSFQKTITTVFQGLDKDRATMTHMRGYGDRMTPQATAWLHSCREALVF